MTRLIVQKLTAEGWVEATFEGYDGRITPGGHAGFVSKALDRDDDQ
jgi:hypothetical protein